MRLVAFYFGNHPEAFIAAIPRAITAQTTSSQLNQTKLPEYIWTISHFGDNGDFFVVRAGTRWLKMFPRNNNNFRAYMGWGDVNKNMRRLDTRGVWQLQMDLGVCTRRKLDIL